LHNTLIFLEYLDFGLIPIKGFWPENIEEFEKFMGELSPSDRRKVNRKFRKIFRKIIKRHMGFKKKPSVGWQNTYGVGAQDPTRVQLRNRRRLVHDEITNLIRGRLNA
jgi:hypothetical protein|tara:strand:- start:1529 stop:1852 length:324 start_codon:yes stop_codon:yes gene_type:complete